MRASAFLERVGDSPRLRVIEFFLEGRGLRFSAWDVAEEQGMSVVAVQRQLQGLHARGMVTEEGRDYRRKLYRLNPADAEAQKYVKVYDDLLHKILTGVRS